MQSTTLKLLLSTALISVCAVAMDVTEIERLKNSVENRDYQGVQTFCSNFSQRIPQQWGENVTGVKTQLATKDKVIALTLDLCGGLTDGCDYRYIHFFDEHQIPATLFVTGAWIKKYPEHFEKLSKNPLFTIENHGTVHRPCSVAGKSAYGIKGTASVEEIREEVEDNARLIEKLTGRKPRFYRSGTAYYDEVAVEVVNALGYTVLGFSVVGDKGATASKEETAAALLQARSGDIIILHMNRPEKPCTEGAIAAIQELLKQGFRFVNISEYSLQ